MSQAGAVTRLLRASDANEERGALLSLLQAPPAQAPEAPGVLRFLLKESTCFEPEVTLEGTTKTNTGGVRSLQEELLLYFFVRRFAAVADLHGVLKEAAQPCLHWDWWTVQRTEDLNCALDDFHALLLGAEWTVEGISILSRVVKQLLDPCVRQHVLGFAFQLLQASVDSKTLLSAPGSAAPLSNVKAGQATVIDTKFFEECSRLLLLGVTDLWSAIRKDCAKAATAVVLGFPSLHFVEAFMGSLLNVALGSLSVSPDKSQITAWTEREGALLSLSLLLRSIRMDIAPVVPSESEKQQQQSSVLDDIKGSLRATGPQNEVVYHLGMHSRHRTNCLPRCLVQTLKPVMYQCLRHDQISVRELAAQCLVNYVALCEEPMRLLIFQEVISKLNRIGDDEGLSASAKEPELLEAFEAEGLLDVLAQAAPSLPPAFLVRHWKFVFPTLERYVMHIASSVRQRSSSVVSALAKLSFSTRREDFIVPSSAALELLVQMLLSFAKTREEDTPDFCWQKKEGRLLSIDVLANLLDKNVADKAERAVVLIQKPEATDLIQKRANSPLEFMWAHRKLQSFTSGCVSDCSADSKSESLLMSVDEWLKCNKGKHDLPMDSAAFWQQVIGGWTAQTRNAFGSTQFELHRISRQLLPGLMKLVIRTGQLDYVLSVDLENVATPWDWRCACSKYLLLHLCCQEEARMTSRLSPQLSMASEIRRGLQSMMKTVLAMQESESACSHDTETIVEKVEVLIMAFLCFGGSKDTSRETLRLFDTALELIHAQLPAEMKLCCSHAAGASGDVDNSLDRQLSISLVRMLPAVVSTLQRAWDLTEVSHLEPPSSERTDEGSGEDTAWRVRWLCLARTILAWLSSNDMFRWITISKSEARSLLLESLRSLLGGPQVVALIAHEDQEVDRVTNCLSDVIGKTIAMKDATYGALQEIYLQLWAQRVEQGEDAAHGLITNILELYSRRQQQFAVMTTELKFTGDHLEESAAAWDDWDEEDDVDAVQKALPVNASGSRSSLIYEDRIFIETLQTLQPDKLACLLKAIWTTSALIKDHELMSPHVNSMQQQVEACLHAC